MLAGLLLNPEHVRQYFAGAVISARGSDKTEHLQLDDDDVLLAVIRIFLEESA